MGRPPVTSQARSPSNRVCCRTRCAVEQGELLRRADVDADEVGRVPVPELPGDQRADVAPGGGPPGGQSRMCRAGCAEPGGQTGASLACELACAGDRSGPVLCRYRWNVGIGVGGPAAVPLLSWR